MKKLILLFPAVLLTPLMVFASTGLESVWNVVGPVLIGYGQQYPIIFTVIAFMGTARLVMKPLMSLTLVVVDITPSTKDNEFIEKLKQNSIYKVVVYLLDWSLSVKLPKK